MLFNRILLVFILFLSLASSSFANQKNISSTVNRQGDYVVKQLVSPDFDRLPLGRKIFAYYLSKAVEMGRNIAWQQNSREGLAIRTLLENLWAYSDYFSPTSKAKLSEYFFKLLANHGNYNKNANQKFVPESFTYEEFFEMARQAEARAIKAGVSPADINFVSESERLKEHVFNKDFEKFYHANGDGLDLVGDSAANYYGKDLTRADIESMDPVLRDHFLSYPKRDGNGNIVLDVHRIGGRFDLELRLMDFFLGKAEQYGNDSEKIILEAHRKAMRTGDPKDLLAAETLWVQYRPTDLDFVLGFIEVYGDPLGKRGAWEGFVVMLNQSPETLARIKAIRLNADYFEKNMPVPENFKKEPGFTPPQAEGAYLLFTGGDNGERPFAGVNLPNDPGIHEQFGSKSYTALNVMHEIGGKVGPTDTASAKIFYTPKYQAMLQATDGILSSNIQVEFHEILGHGSGKNDPGISDGALQEYYNAMEEGRAEIASLYHLTDSRLRELAILPSGWSAVQAADFAEMTVVTFFTSQIRSYFKLPENTQKIRQAHQWGRQVMLNRLLADGAIRVVESELGVPQVEVINLEKVRESLGRLWSEIQVAKSTGNYEASKNLYEAWGQYQDIHRKWRAAINKAMDELRLPREPVFMNPVFKIKKNAAGEIESVRLKFLSSKSPLESFPDREVKRSRAFKKLCQNPLL